MYNNTIKRIKMTDYQLVRSWYAKRGLPIPELASFADTGFMADGRVAGFIYITNSNVALIDGLISNPDTIPSLRRESMNKLVPVLIEFAITLGCTNIIALTNHPSVKKLCKQHGFAKTGYECFILSESDADSYTLVQENLRVQDVDDIDE